MGSSGNEILDMYIYETNTLLEQLETIVLEAEKADTFSQDDVNEIFRIMHTIKGSSAMMEYNSLMAIAHRAEDLFSIIRDKTMDVVPESLRPELFDLLFQPMLERVSHDCKMQRRRGIFRQVKESRLDTLERIFKTEIQRFSLRCCKIPERLPLRNA